jgi:hypothetical protein
VREKLLDQNTNTPIEIPSHQIEMEYVPPNNGLFANVTLEQDKT